MKPIDFLKKHNRDICPYLIAMVIIAAIYAFLGIVFSLLMRSLIDEALAGFSDTVIWYSIFFIGVVVLQVTSHFLENYLSMHLRCKVRTNMQRVVFQEVIGQNDLENHSGYYLARLTSDVSHVTTGVTEILPKMALSITKFVFALIALLVLDYLLTLFIVAVGILFILCHFIYKKVLVKYHQEYQNSEAQSHSFMQEMLENQSIVHSFGKDYYLNQENDRRLDALYHSEIKRSSITVFANLGFNIGILGAYTLIIVFCVFRLSAGSFLYKASFTFGTLTAIMSLFSQIQSPLSSVAEINQRYILLIESTKRLMELFKEKEEAEYADNFQMITLDDFSFSYSDKEIFNHTYFSIRKGDTMTIRGPSGIGKSTLIKILLGKIKADKPILVDGKPLNISHLISYVPQGNWLLSGTIRDNLTVYDDSITDAEIKEALEVVALPEFYNLLNCNIKERAKDISEGQAQRLAIARGLLLKREILLLDEVTSALDSETEHILLANLANLHKTLIYVSHKNAVNSYSNRLCEIHDHKLIEVMR